MKPSNRGSASHKYLFADESGNFDFRDHHRFPGASKYYAVGTLLVEDDATKQAIERDLADLRYDLARNGLAHHEPFHASTDPQHVRDAVYDVLKRHAFKVDVTILEKAKAQPQTRTSDPRFHQYAWYYHFKYFADRYFKPNDELMVVAASLGTKRGRKSFQAAVESVVTQCADYRVKRSFGFWPSATDPCLQAADYALWAVMRDVDGGDDRSRVLLEDKIRSVYDLWRVGRTYYYGPKAKRRRRAASA